MAPTCGESGVYSNLVTVILLEPLTIRLTATILQGKAPKEPTWLTAAEHVGLSTVNLEIESAT